MLSNKVKKYLSDKGWWHDFIHPEYPDALARLNIDLQSDVAEFYLHAEGDPTFYSRYREIYQICWFIINSNYDLDVKFTNELLRCSEEYIPLDSFEGEYGYFYNRKTGEVLEIGLGQEMLDFYEGKFKPQWKDFNSFLEWYFELTN
ncbi:hypothetical protein [Xenorhabdus innexi]|uniref:Knr4/Smi1-like domain-containing protein n=1 Tax=Xenorhabdus innexi TaxID=290109 RepID=A0A1N6MW60_9GAMM|nr:hypothetical protein [Xenorhabdus innexi]PHM36576.1 hypothetical protein Xinn_01519 [Xenorhabdus innexi]SIP73123.1 conserved hypothetical protein [Xenorhabdus innexi]